MKNISKFPSKGKRLAVLWKLITVFFQHMKQKVPYRKNPFHVSPNPMGLLGFNLFSFANPHNFGELLRKFPETDEGAEFFEADTVSHMVHLFGGKNDNVTGHFVTGASEGNIYSMALGKSYLHSLRCKNIVLLTTTLTHESVLKAASIMGIPIISVGLDTNLAVSASSLKKTIHSFATQKYDGFIYCATQGYKATGTSDNYEEVVRIFRQERRLRAPRFHYYVWVDAALDGLITPFVESTFKPLKNEDIQLMTMDFHKLGFSPYAAGVVLARRSLIRLMDNWETPGLLESRSTLPAVAAWSSLHDLGRNNLIKRFIQSQKIRKDFLSALSFGDHTASIHAPASNISVFIESSKKQLLRIKPLEGVYPIRCSVRNTLIENRWKKLYGVKIYFLPSFSARRARSLAKALIAAGI